MILTRESGKIHFLVSTENILILLYKNVNGDGLKNEYKSVQTIW